MSAVLVIIVYGGMANVVWLEGILDGVTVFTFDDDVRSGVVAGAIVPIINL